MNPKDHKTWMDNATLEELVDSCIWQSVMEGTAWCGWTDRARKGLVEEVQRHVRWAIEYKKPKDAAGE